MDFGNLPLKFVKSELPLLENKCDYVTGVVAQMDEPMVSRPAVSSLVNVTVIYQIGPVYFCLLQTSYVTVHNPDKTRALQLNYQQQLHFDGDKTILPQGLFS